MIIAIHQPNYLPWIGYFYKIARADTFVLLDNVQFSKNSYINRVKVLAGEEPRWLTVPVSVRLGDPIDRVMPARADWPDQHQDKLLQWYRRAAAFAEVWPTIEALYAAVPRADLATINRYFIEALCQRLGLTARLVVASQFATGEASGDERLIRLVRAIDPLGTYLSGRGGANYQEERKFTRAGLTLTYSDFVHPYYTQQGSAFIPGLSIVDALFHCGWAAVGRWLYGQGAAAPEPAHK